MFRKLQLEIPTSIRCVGMWRASHSQWVAYSLEFGLAAQAESFEEAKQKLEVQISDFIRIALEESQSAPQFASQLLKRKAPLWAFAVWYLMQGAKAMGTIPKLKNRRAFVEPMPPLALAA